MLQSRLFTKTKRESPKGEKSVNAILLQRAGFCYKEMAGVYTYLPLGLRVLRKIERIVREEMENVSGQEILMSVLQPKSLWLKTGRWKEGIGEVMYKCKGKEEIGLGPTHEEMLTDIVRNYIHSFEDLPVYIYQIQTKFRKEPRARSGLIRGREFEMKDLYSFHQSESDFKKYYKKVQKAYFKIFRRCGLKAILTEASGVGFTKGYTHEFQVLSAAGEDTIVYCPKGHFSQNKEVAKFQAGDNCPVCGEKLLQGKAIEVGNIFPLGVKYSQSIGAFFQDRDGKKKPIIMGCYGVGISRLMGAIVEVHHDGKGIIWPGSVSPFDVHLLSLQLSNKMSQREKLEKAAKKVYRILQKQNVDVLYDDRKNKSPGEKFADADLIGIPYRIVVSERMLRKQSVEIKRRDKKIARFVKIKQLPAFLRKNLRLNKT